MKSTEELREELRYRLVERYERLLTLGMLDVAHQVLQGIKRLDEEARLEQGGAGGPRLVHLSELEGNGWGPAEKLTAES